MDYYISLKYEESIRCIIELKLNKLNEKNSYKPCPNQPKG